MTFLAPAFWIGLALATLPVLIHLLGRRRLRRQPFSSLEFLRRLQTKRMRRLRLKQILLLVLRTLALLALALAFLRPALRAAGFAGAGSSATVIIVDESASMAARRGEAEPIERAVAVAREIWRAGGELGLVSADESGERDISLRDAAGDPPRWLQRFESDGRGETFTPALRRAVRLLGESHAASREIILLSDFTSDPPDSLPVPESVALRRVPLAEGSATNVAATGVRLSRALVRPGSSGELEVTLRQFGGSDEQPVLVTISLDGRVVAEGEVTVPERGSVTHSFSFRVPESGRHPGRVELDATDALYADNARHFVLTVPGERTVLLAGDDLGALRYAELALNPGGVESAFAVTVRPGPLRNVARLDEYDAILYAGAASPTAADARRLRQYVETGGGLWLVLGETADLAAWSRTLLPELGFGGVVSEGRYAKGVRRWETLDRSHPALAGLFEGEGRYDRPQVSRVYASRGGEGARVLVRLSDGTPFLAERSVERGRVWWTPSAIDTEWTDWPLAGVFAPIVQEGMLWLAGGEPEAAGVDCGEPILWPAPGRERNAGGEVIAPGERRLSAQPAFAGGRPVLVTEQTWWPGHYELLFAGEPAGVAAANVPAGESDLRVRNEGWPGAELTPREDETLAEALTRARVGRELTPWLLLLALAALVAETLIARERRQAAPAREPARQAA
ncbi:MAG: hypothetical protein MAG453_00570 [Calditrichaeota bacterium]|nr:hypothetical protein [Calditrichota bacterium]